MQAFFYLLQRDADFENGFVGPVDKKNILIREGSQKNQNVNFLKNGLDPRPPLPPFKMFVDLSKNRFN